MMIDRALPCCVQEHSKQPLASARLTRLTAEQIVVAVCRLCVGRLNKDVTWSHNLGYWAFIDYVEQIMTDTHMRLKLRQTTEISELDNGERFIG